ncbi:hypothetical protein [Paenibacillus pini]|uniref:Uncharacterized protein n=1 Tax=Paenibacillus pini JCM 16418 TaxID=1236976 RepID=W7Z1G6_9BACL|nr:hypothetical protein [Paenibacillus pini]GAF10831.1 hypothetical protein JCM16418_5056 [Paenibacillus pini JCM 16418]
MLKTTEQLIERALDGVELATDISHCDHSSKELRRVLFDLAEDGAWSEYEGNGYFEDVHISEMSDREIARILIRDYANA